MELLIIATDYINGEPGIGHQSASEWIGTSLEVEQQSMPTSGYSTEVTESFRHGMQMTCGNMARLGQLSGRLNEAGAEKLDRLLYDFSLLAKSRGEVGKRKKAK